MYSFTMKLLLYALPFVVSFGGLAAGLIYTGEAMPLALVVSTQMGDEPVLYRPKYGNRDYTYKLVATRMRQPEVLAIGSSRVLQLRSPLFNNNRQAFYNAGGPAWTLDMVDDFLLELEATSSQPKILIIGLDPPWFQGTYAPDDMPPPHISDWQHLVQTTASVVQDAIFEEAFDVNQMLERKEPWFGGTALGFRAIRDGHGFRNDGSEQYGDFLVAHFLNPEWERDRHRYYLENGEEMYLRGDHVSEEEFQQLADMLQRCQDQGIYVIGYSPPYMPDLYQMLMASDQHGYVRELWQLLPTLFDQYGFAYFDFADSTALNATENDFFDGWHASELIHVYMYLRMLEALPDVLGPYSDGNYLYERIAQTTDTFNVFGNEF